MASVIDGPANGLRVARLARRRESRRFVYTFIVFAMAWLPGLSAQQGDAGSRERAVEVAVRAKYAKVDGFDYRVTPDGPAGLFFLSGDLTPRSGVAKARRAAAGSPKAIAQEFLREEATMFGLDRSEEELRERTSETDRNGRTHIFYTKHIEGLKVDGVDIRVHLEHDGSIFAINGNLVPISTASLPRVVAAARAAHISDDQVREVVRGDLAQEPDILFRTEKVVVPSPPFVVWKVDAVLEKKLGRWLYTIDAFTGAIISKANGLQSFSGAVSSPAKKPVP